MTIDSSIYPKLLIARNFDSLLQTAIKRHNTIFSEPTTITYSRIVVRHADGSRFDVHGATYEYASLEIVPKIAVISLQKQKMLIVYPGHHPVLLFFVSDLKFVDVY